MDLALPTAAYHEAGHVLIAHLLGGRVVESSLESERAEHVGHTTVEWSGLSRDDRVRCSALVALAGPVAEVLWRGEEVLDEDLSVWRADWDEVDLALGQLADLAQHEALREHWLRELNAKLNGAAVWERLCRIADSLEAHGTLDRELLSELLT